MNDFILKIELEDDEPFFMSCYGVSLLYDAGLCVKGYRCMDPSEARIPHQKINKMTNNSPLLSRPIDDLELTGSCLTGRTYRCLKAENIENLIELTSWTKNDLLKVPNLGRKSLKDIIERLATHNLKLKEN